MQIYLKYFVSTIENQNTSCMLKAKLDADFQLISVLVKCPEPSFLFLDLPREFSSQPIIGMRGLRQNKHDLNEHFCYLF